MDTVEAYLTAYRQLGDEAFLKQYDHPFLLYLEHHGHGGFRSYHTRMADREAAANLNAVDKPLRDFRVLAPASSGQSPQPAKLLVGRTEDRDLYIDHSTVSKRHAYLIREESQDTYRLGDAGSTNGTFLNGKSVEAGEPVYLRDGNVVSFGDCAYLFFSPKGFVMALDRLSNES